MTPFTRATAAVLAEIACGEENARHVVRAVLGAIREPDARMLSDGAFQVFRGERIAEDDIESARRVWRAMIAAIREGE